MTYCSILLGIRVSKKAKFETACGSEVKASACNAGDLGSTPRSGRFPWRRKWQPTPVFLPGESHGPEEPGRLQSMASQRVGHD